MKPRAFLPLLQISQSNGQLCLALNYELLKREMVN